MGVFIISPTEKGGCLHQPSDKLSSLCAPFSPMVFNDLFCLFHPEIHTLSIGASKPSDFDEHLKVLPLLADPTTVPVMEKIVRRLEAEFLQVNGRPMPRRWDAELPSYQNVPGGINLQEIVRLWSLDRAFDMQVYGKLRYNLLGNGGHWFPGVNAASFDESAIRAIGGQLPDILRDAHERFGDIPRQRLQQND